EEAAGAVGDRAQQLTDLSQIVGGRLGPADAGEPFGDGQAILLAGRALTARLHCEEAGDTRGHGGEVGGVVEHDEPAGTQPSTGGGPAAGIAIVVPAGSSGSGPNSSMPCRYGGAMRGNGGRPSSTSSSPVSSPKRYSRGPATIPTFTSSHQPASRHPAMASER